jgi:hypothetical protein
VGFSRHSPAETSLSQDELNFEFALKSAAEAEIAGMAPRAGITVMSTGPYAAVLRSGSWREN